jgi:hypothetical protein
VLNLIGKQALKLAVLQEERPAVKDKWCDEQQKDIENFFQAVEDLVSTAQNAGSSPMAYAQLQQAKADFVAQTLECWSRYRMIDDPKDYRREMRS